MRNVVRIAMDNEGARIAVVTALLAAFVAIVVAYPFPGSEVSMSDILVTDCSDGGGNKDYVQFSFEELVVLTDLVIRGTVESCQDNGFAATHDVRVLETLRGDDVTGTVIHVAGDQFCCFGQGLEHYMLLRKDDQFTYSTVAELSFIVAGSSVILNYHAPYPYSNEILERGSLPRTTFLADLEAALANTRDIPNETPEEIGAQFPESSGTSIRPGKFSPKLTRDEAEAIALKFVMDGYDIIKGEGYEDMFDVRSTTGLYSGGAKLDEQPAILDRKDSWPIQDREVWVVVVYDTPIIVPFGSPGMVIREEDIPPVRVNLATDAATGEIIGGALTGGRSPGAKWEPYLERVHDEAVRDAVPTPPPTSTPEQGGK